MGERVLISGFIKSEQKIRKGCIVADSGTGLIENVKYETNTDRVVSGTLHKYDEEFIIEAGDFNAHSHPEQSIYTDIVDKTWDLPTWCRNTIYKYSTLLKPEHIYLACCRAFSRMLRYGVTSVMVSFYCHNNMGNTYDMQVIKAALDTGIRLYFGRMNYDIINEDVYEEKKNSQKSYFENADEAEKNFISLMEEAKFPNVVVAPSVHSIHASTKYAIVKAINLGNKYDRYVQFHLSEDRGDVQLSLNLYKLRPVNFLVSLLKNNEVSSLKNVILSDCVWIDDEERQLILDYGMKVVLNPRMNDRIKTGQADLVKMIQKGINPYLGTDGEASNDDLSIEGERRFLKSKYAEIPYKTIDSLGSVPIKFLNGFIGGIAPGSYCDLKIKKGETVEDVFVGGAKVVSKSKIVNMDIDSLVEAPLKYWNKPANFSKR